MLAESNLQCFGNLPERVFNKLIFLHQTQEDVAMRNVQLLREQEISREEATRVREQYHEQKMRQQIRENNQELRVKHNTFLFDPRLSQETTL